MLDAAASILVTAGGATNLLFARGQHDRACRLVEGSLSHKDSQATGAEEHVTWRGVAGKPTQSL